MQCENKCGTRTMHSNTQTCNNINFAKLETVSERFLFISNIILDAEICSVVF